MSTSRLNDRRLASAQEMVDDCLVSSEAGREDNAYGVARTLGEFSAAVQSAEIWDVSQTRSGAAFSTAAQISAA